MKKQSVERKIQDKKKMCSARSRKEGKTLLVHESSDYEESEPDEPEKQKKRKGVHETSDFEESDHDKSEV